MPLAGALAPVVYLSCSVSLGALLKRCQKAEIEISAANDAVPRPDPPPAATLLRLAPFQQVAHAFTHATHRTLPLRLPSHVSSITRLELDVMYLYLFRCASLLSFATSADLPKLSQTAKTTQSVSMLATLALSSASQCVQIKSHISYICCGSDRGLTALFPLQIQLKFWLRSD